MTIVLTLAAPEHDVLDAQIAFHLHAGVELVLVHDAAVPAESNDIVDAYVRCGAVQRISLPSVEPTRLRHELAAAAREHGADWIIDAEPGEFWWPRGESLQDVLVAIPPRYGIVQGLMRTFVPDFDGEGTFDERMTRRDTVHREHGRSDPRAWLRPMFRPHDHLEVERDGSLGQGVAVPLRAWYPIEVLRFPLRGKDQAARRAESPDRWLHPPRTPLELAWVEGRPQRAAEAEIVDRRLQEALESIRARAPGPSDGRAFLVPADATAVLFTAPDIVADAAFAAECAEVGEVDLEKLERQIRALQQRLAALEHPFWPRARRRLARLVRR